MDDACLHLHLHPLSRCDRAAGLVSAQAGALLLCVPSDRTGPARQKRANVTDGAEGARGVAGAQLQQELAEDAAAATQPRRGCVTR